jgi:hypothetical protein
MRRNSHEFRYENRDCRSGSAASDAHAEVNRCVSLPKVFARADPKDNGEKRQGNWGQENRRPVVREPIAARRSSSRNEKKQNVILTIRDRDCAGSESDKCRRCRLRLLLLPLRPDPRMRDLVTARKPRPVPLSCGGMLSVYTVLLRLRDRSPLSIALLRADRRSWRHATRIWRASHGSTHGSHGPT